MVSMLSNLIFASNRVFGDVIMIPSPNRSANFSSVGLRSNSYCSFPCTLILNLTLLGKIKFSGRRRVIPLYNSDRT